MRRQLAEPLRIETRRLLLRRLGPADRSAVARLFAIPEVRRHLDVDIESPADAVAFADEFIRRAAAERWEGGTGSLAVQARRGGLLGYCGLRACESIDLSTGEPAVTH